MKLKFGNKSWTGYLAIALFLLALITSAWPTMLGAFGTVMLVLIGIVLGIVNVTSKERELFLLGVLVLTLVSAGITTTIVPVDSLMAFADAFFAAIAFAFAPAAVVAAAGAIFGVTKSK